MDRAKRKKLHIPSGDEVLGMRVRRYSIPAPILPSWPWRATMICAVNCYLLWAFTWFQFLMNFVTFSIRGRNLPFYTAKTEPFGVSLPELFLALSIILSLFAICSVIGRTRTTPRLWKRLLAVMIFATIAIWSSCLSLHLRHYSYERALIGRDLAFEEYHWHLTTDPYGDNDKEFSMTKWHLKRVEEFDSQILNYEKKYDLPHQDYRGRR